MYVTLVYVQVTTDRVADFIAATRLNHESAIQEKGNLRFDVLQQADDPTRFVLYEAYASEQEATAHKDTAHYNRWRDQVAAWMAVPRTGVVHKGLLPC